MEEIPNFCEREEHRIEANRLPGRQKSSETMTNGSKA